MSQYQLASPSTEFSTASLPTTPGSHRSFPSTPGGVCNFSGFVRVNVKSPNSDADVPLQISITRRGYSGCPHLLLIHGVGHNKRGWDVVTEALQEDFDVIAVDLPGHGESETTPAHVTPSYLFFADVMEALCEALGISRPHVAGNSLGGQIALELTGRGKAASATCLSPVGFSNEFELKCTKMLLQGMLRFGQALKPFFKALAGGFLSKAMMAFICASGPHLQPNEVEEMARSFVDVSRLSDTIDALCPQLPPPEVLSGVPISIAWGVKDLLLPPIQATRVPQRVPTAAVTMLGACGHVPMADDPLEVVRLIRQTAVTPTPRRKKSQ